MPYVFIAILVLIVIVIIANIKIVPQSKAYVLERLGAYNTTWQTGFHVKVPFIDRIAKQVSLKEQVVDFPPQPVITKDNVTMQIDTIVFFQITDPKLFAYGVERPIAAIENLSATTLRNIVGSMTLDETLTGRDEINDKITAILDEATDKYGIKVHRVEVKNIDPPRSADAVKEQRIREAQGEAEALLAVQRARAEGIRLINESMPSDAYLKIRSFEAAEKMADGQSTKIIVPSDVANLAGTLNALKESASDK